MRMRLDCMQFSRYFCDRLTIGQLRRDTLVILFPHYCPVRPFSVLTSSVEKTALQNPKTRRLITERLPYAVYCVPAVRTGNEILR
jgi:hypothetical protein